MQGYTEDDLAKALIEFYRDEGDINIKIEPEAPYDHYGKRGVPDLYVIFQRVGLTAAVEAHLTEIKSESAVKAATGANEIIRQFKQMRRNFYKDEERWMPHPAYEWETVFIVFELSFIPTEYNILHIFDNLELYEEAITDNFVDPIPVDVSPDTFSLEHPAEMYQKLRRPV